MAAFLCCFIGSIWLGTILFLTASILSTSVTELSRSFGLSFLFTSDSVIELSGFSGTSSGYKWFTGLVIIMFPGNCISADRIFESLLTISLNILPILQLLLGKLSSFMITILPSVGSFSLCDLGGLCTSGFLSLKLKRYSSLQDFQNMSRCFCPFFQCS